MKYARRCSAVMKATALLLLLQLLASSAMMSAVAGEQRQRKQADVRDSEPDAFLEVPEATFSAAATGCGLCQETGLCSHAFKGNPGHFCLTLATGLPCCCPLDAQCASSAYNCRCRRTASQGNHPAKVVSRPSSPTSDGTKFLSLTSLFGMLLCVICCMCAVRNRNERAPLARDLQPAYVSSSYGATEQSPAKYAYAYPSAPVESYEPPYATPAVEQSRGYRSSAAAGAVGAVAGLAGGYFLGSAVSGDGSHTEPTTTTTTTYFGGDSGFNNASSTYDFAGDTGDYGGDSGGDLGGDS